MDLHSTPQILAGVCQVPVIWATELAVAPGVHTHQDPIHLAFSMAEPAQAKADLLPRHHAMALGVVLAAVAVDLVTAVAEPVVIQVVEPAVEAVEVMSLELQRRLSP